MQLHGEKAMSEKIEGGVLISNEEYAVFMGLLQEAREACAEVFLCEDCYKEGRSRIIVKSINTIEETLSGEKHRGIRE